MRPAAKWAMKLQVDKQADALRLRLDGLRHRRGRAKEGSDGRTARTANGGGGIGCRP